MKNKTTGRDSKMEKYGRFVVSPRGSLILEEVAIPPTELREAASLGDVEVSGYFNQHVKLPRKICFPARGSTVKEGIWYLLGEIRYLPTVNVIEVVKEAKEPPTTEGGWWRFTPVATRRGRTNGAWRSRVPSGFRFYGIGIRDGERAKLDPALVAETEKERKGGGP